MSFTEEERLFAADAFDKLGYRLSGRPDDLGNLGETWYLDGRGRGRNRLLTLETYSRMEERNPTPIKAAPLDHGKPGHLYALSYPAFQKIYLIELHKMAELIERMRRLPNGVKLADGGYMTNVLPYRDRIQASPRSPNDEFKLREYSAAIYHCRPPVKPPRWQLWQAGAFTDLSPDARFLSDEVEPRAGER